MPRSIVPGLSDPARSRERFDKWIRERVNEIGGTVLARTREEMKLIAADIIDNSPVWTGASAGDLDRGKVPMTRHHPAFGMIIGNQFDGAYDVNLSGYQIIESAREKGKNVTLSLVNNMWDKYLKYVERGTAPHQTHRPRFVRDAWMRHIARRRSQ